MKILRLLWLGLLLTAALRAAAPIDLGQNLFYAGSAQLADPSVAALPAVILDLRDASSPETALPLINARSGKPTYVLLGSPLAIPRQRGLLTFGPAKTKADIEVAAAGGHSASELARLRAAGLNRDGINRLIIQNPDKPRYDEAALVREHQQAAADSANSDGGADDKDPAAKPDSATAPESEKEKEKPLIDSVLQRAVLVHRGLTVLKKS